MKRKKSYKGAPVEKGATSISGDASPPIRWLAKKGYFKKGTRVLDWGAGKSGRNADYLRALGCKVYAYDPNHRTHGNGWQRGSVTDRTPKSGVKFDVAISCYVLNVVRLKDERAIIRALKSRADKVVHITRSEADLLDMARATLVTAGKANPHILHWYYNQYWTSPTKPSKQRLIKSLPDFLTFGFKTGKNKFQRLVNSSTMKFRGYRPVKQTTSYTVYADLPSRRILPSK